MRKILLTAGVLAATACALLAPATAMADEPSLALRVEPGVAIPLTSPQTDRFHPGFYGSLKPTLELTPWFEANVTVSALVLGSKRSDTDYGQALGAGVGARLKLPTGDRTGWSAVQPWIDGDAQYIRSGALDRAQFSIGVGATVPVNESRSVRVGPLVRYLDVVESLNDKPNFDTHDAHILVLGLSLEFGASAPKKAEPVPPAPQPLPVPVVVTVTPVPEPTPAPNPPVTVTETFHGIVQFPYDSSVPLNASNPVIQAALKLLQDNADLKVTLEGHTSSEGTNAYNQKLSERRANAVRDFLIKSGVAADRLTIVGFGEDRPVADNATDAGRRLNRRVEYTVSITITKESAK